MIANWFEGAGAPTHLEDILMANKNGTPWWDRPYPIRAASAKKTGNNSVCITLPREIGLRRLGREYTFKLRPGGIIELHPVPVEESGEQRHDLPD